MFIDGRGCNEPKGKQKKKEKDMPRVPSQPETQGERMKIRRKPGPKPMSEEQRKQKAEMRKKRAAKKYIPIKKKIWNFQKTAN